MGWAGMVLALPLYVVVIMNSYTLISQLEQLIEQTRATLGICVQLAGGPPLIRHNPDMVFPSASLIKLPIYYEYLRQCQRGRLDPNMSIIMQKELWVDGSGVIKNAPPGTVYSLHQAAGLMLTHSDNVATNLMIDMVGPEHISRAISHLGMGQTALRRKMYDFAARDRGLDNQTSPQDVQGFLLRMQQPGADEQEIAQGVIRILKAQSVNHKLPGLLPREVVMAHKTGELDRVQHDAGIIYAGGLACCVTFMSQDLPSNAAGAKICSQVGRLVYEAMMDRSME